MGDAAAAVIRAVRDGDEVPLAAIYNHYVNETVVTFEEVPVTAEEMRRRIDEVSAAAYPWLVAELDGRVIGYSYASAWRSRSGYRFSCEATVYLAPGEGGHGAGSALYARLIDALRARGNHAVMGGIALPNAASVALHEKLGFRNVAQFEQTGFKFGRWVDVGYWELML
jgi:L-amino acid N-acyltransferase YncA